VRENIVSSSTEFTGGYTPVTAIVSTACQNERNYRNETNIATIDTIKAE